MRRYSLIFTGLVTVVALTLVACADTPAPRGAQESGAGQRQREGGEAKPEAEKVAKVEKGVVPDVILAEATDAEKAIKKAGFTPVFDSLGITFVDTDPSPEDLVCEQDPEAGAEPEKGSDVVMIWDRLRKC